MISRIKAFAPAVQNGGAALLIEGNAELVARSGADGAHFTGIEAMQEALPTLKPGRIVGVGGLITRHDSMAQAKPAPITCCSASRMPRSSGLRRTRSPSGCNGGPNCSSRLASALR